MFFSVLCLLSAQSCGFGAHPFESAGVGRKSWRKSRCAVGCGQLCFLRYKCANWSLNDFRKTRVNDPSLPTLVAFLWVLGFLIGLKCSPQVEHIFPFTAKEDVCIIIFFTLRLIMPKLTLTLVFLTQTSRVATCSLHLLCVLVAHLTDYDIFSI